MQVDGSTALGGNDHVTKILEPERAADVADQKFAGVLVGKAASRVSAEPLQGALHLLQRDTEGAHGRWIGRDAELPHLAADRDDLSHSGDGQQPGPDDEIRDLADLHG